MKCTLIEYYAADSIVLYEGFLEIVFCKFIRIFAPQKYEK
jgi:hypothetical protein